MDAEPINDLSSADYRKKIHDFAVLLGEPTCTEVRKLLVYIAEQTTRIAELEKDAARLSKVIAAIKVGDHLYHDFQWCWHNDEDDQITNYYVTAREAIDALCQPIDAMKG